VIRTVVIADAAASVRELVRTLLERDDLVFVDALDGTDALVAVEEHRPSLVVLDLDLPPYGGMDVIDRIREHDDVPILVLALRDDAPEARTLYLRGADEILLKPIDGWELVATAELFIGAEDEELSTPIVRRA
jgi:DNA-binding response OmpR family regulator